jgi:hypothetical protein
MIGSHTTPIPSASFSTASATSTHRWALPK